MDTASNISSNASKMQDLKAKTYALNSGKLAGPQRKRLSIKQ